MKIYDPTLALIVIHMPKTAGTSVQALYKSWFSDGLLLHYYNEAEGRMPIKYDIAGMHSKTTPLAIYGHFNKSRGFGVEQYYPEIQLFVTILRDPFERAVSGYFYLRKQAQNYKDQSRLPKNSLRDTLLDSRASLTNQFPRETTLDNYKEIIESLFIEVGVTEYLDESLARIAKKLNKSYDPESLQHLNATERDLSEIPYELKEEFMETKSLDYAIYNYVLAKYT